MKQLRIIRSLIIGNTLLLLFLTFSMIFFQESYSYETEKNSMLERVQNATTIYDTKRDNISLPSLANNDRTFTRQYFMDGNESVKYTYTLFSNYYEDSPTVVNGTDKRHLATGEYLTFTIDDLNIDLDNYQDVRIDLDYLAPNSYDDLTKTYGLKITYEDSAGNIHGPYYLEDPLFNGYYKYQTSTTEQYYYGYDLISQNLKEAILSNITIKKIIIQPYGNLPRIIDDTNTFAGDWRKQAAAFNISTIRILGFEDSNYVNPYVVKKTINPEDTATAIVQRMYDSATMKWQLKDNSIVMHPVFSVNGTKFKESVTYKATDEEGKRIIYYGAPYNQRNRVTNEKFFHELKNGEYQILTNSEGTQSLNTYGQDCATSVYYSASKYLSFVPGVLGVSETIWNRDKTTLLGDLKNHGTDSSSNDVYRDLYNTYKTDDSSNPIKDNASLLIDKRIKSNDVRTWYSNIASPNGEMDDLLGYTDLKKYNYTNPDTGEITSFDGIVSGDPLKISIDSLNIPASSNVQFEFTHYPKNTTTELLNKSNLKIYFCAGSDCQAVGEDVITISEPIDYNETYKKVNVTANYVTTNNITSVQIVPYNAISTGKVFWLHHVTIKINNNPYYSMQASEMGTLFNLINNRVKDTPGLNSTIERSVAEQINGTIGASAKKDLLAYFMARQDISKGYSELKPGDLIATHSQEGSIHIRMASGTSHVVCLDGTVLGHNNDRFHTVNGTCDNHKGINTDLSYFIRTDIASSAIKTTYASRNNFGGYINSNDYVVPWTPNRNYTDLNDISDIETKDTDQTVKYIDFHFNQKTDYTSAIGTAYLPITYNAYLTGNTEEPYAIILNKNTIDDIKDGFKGSIYSNYTIISLNYHIKNLKTSREENITVYPNNSPSKDDGSDYNKEGLNVGVYSLYYNTPKEVQDKVKEIINAQDDFEVSVSVSAGYNDNIQVLNLRRDSTVYAIRLNINNIFSSNINTTLNPGEPFTTILSANNGYALPESIIVKINGVEITNFSYNSSTGELSVPGDIINGDIEIIAQAINTNTPSEIPPSTTTNPDTYDRFVFYLVTSLIMIISLIILNIIYQALKLNTEKEV